MIHSQVLQVHHSDTFPDVTGTSQGYIPRCYRYVTGIDIIQLLQVIYIDVYTRPYLTGKQRYVFTQVLQVSYRNIYMFVISFNYVHPLGGGHIIFAFSAVRRHTWFPDILGNSSYPIPNLACRFIGLKACMGLLLVMIAL